MKEVLLRHIWEDAPDFMFFGSTENNSQCSKKVNHRDLHRRFSHGSMFFSFCAFIFIRSQSNVPQLIISPCRKL